MFYLRKKMYRRIVIWIPMPFMAIPGIKCKPRWFALVGFGPEHPDMWIGGRIISRDKIGRRELVFISSTSTLAANPGQVAALAWRLIVRSSGDGDIFQVRNKRCRISVDCCQLVRPWLPVSDSRITHDNARTCWCIEIKIGSAATGIADARGPCTQACHQATSGHRQRCSRCHEQREPGRDRRGNAQDSPYVSPSVRL